MKNTSTTPSIIPSPSRHTKYSNPLTVPHLHLTLSPPLPHSPLSHFPSFHRPLVFPGKKTAFPPRVYVSDGATLSAPPESLFAALETILCSLDCAGCVVGWVDCFCASAFSAASESKEVVESRRVVIVIWVVGGMWHRVV